MKKFYNILVWFVAFVLCSCGNNQPEEQILVVGTSADNPPYSFVEGEEVRGLEIDLINKIAQNKGMEIKIKNMPFDGLIQSLLRGDIDLIIAGVTKTKEREEVVDFSVPYNESNIVLLLKDGFEVNDINELSGKVIGAQLGSIWLNEAKEIAKVVRDVDLKVLNNNLLLVEELKSGNIDAMVLEEVQAANFSKKNVGLKIFNLNKQSPLCIAFRKGSGLRPQINKIILELGADGYMGGLEQKWLSDSMQH